MTTRRLSFSEWASGMEMTALRRAMCIISYELLVTGFEFRPGSPDSP